MITFTALTSYTLILLCRSFLCGSVVKNLPASAGDEDLMPGSGRSSGEDLWRRKWQPTPEFLPWKPHRQRSKRVEHNLETKQQQYFFVHKDKILNYFNKHKTQHR